MATAASENAREKLVKAGIDLFRRRGYVAATVDEICAEAGVTKGAFFHHFDSKETLAETCLQVWDQQFLTMIASAPFQSLDDPVAKVLACIDFFIGVFANPQVLKSCLAGTTVQEVSETHPALRDAAQACFASGQRQFQSLLDAACRSRSVQLDTASLARLWMATIQGSLLLCKASGDGAVIGKNLDHFQRYLQTLLTDSSSIDRTEQV